jgi:hypothetical protein
MYSHKDKFIYVHIPKSAGTFIKHYLLSNIEEGYAENQNQQDYDDKYHVTCERSLSAIVRDVPDYKDYYKFTIVRNPFDRVVSMFSYLGGWKFDYFVENNIESPMMPYVQEFHKYYMLNDFDGFVTYAYEGGYIKKFHAGYYENYIDRISLNGTVAIDKFYKMENIKSCVSDLSKKFNFKNKSGFNDWRQNSSSEYKKKPNYRDYYSDYSREYIGDHFQSDLEYFRYEF